MLNAPSGVDAERVASAPRRCPQGGHRLSASALIAEATLGILPGLAAQGVHLDLSTSVG